MDGNTYEGDETGDTEIFPRYGRGSAEHAGTAGRYGDDEDTGSLPRRNRGSSLDSFTAGRWGEAGSEQWNDPDRDPPSNGGFSAFGPPTSGSGYGQPYQPPTYAYQPPP